IVSAAHADILSFPTRRSSDLCDLSMLTTRRSWLMSLIVLVLGTSTSIPDCRMGAVIIKMMSKTRTTSTNGTMLISESEVCVVLRSEEHTSELQSLRHLVCRLL